jgi:hypothetical protein
MSGYSVAVSLTVSLWAQSTEFKVYTDPPRLLLTPQRLRLLKRERERQSMRWQQFDGLVTSGAPMPEPGFAYALHYQVSGQTPVGKQAIEWALSEKATDLRQLAFVFDWCGLLMTPAQADRLAAKITAAVAKTPPAKAPVDVWQQNTRALAAIALADRSADRGELILKPLIEQWWRGTVVSKQNTGTNLEVIPRSQVYSLLEMLHTVRDNLKLDLREDAPGYFKSLPTDHLVSHYPAPLATRDNEFRIPVYVRDGEPDLADAISSRAAELAMVAYDTNAAENQFLQGWLMQDRFVMRNELGAPYEFLWANPYQPGLSYFQVPLVYHNTESGHIFARTSWDEDARWLGYFDGHLQIFSDGQVQSLKPGAAIEPVHLGDAVILSARDPQTFQFQADAQAVFVVNLAPRALYKIEVDDQELTEDETDVGGTLVLSLPEGVSTPVRIQRRGD